MGEAALECGQLCLEAVLDPQDRVAHPRIERQDLGGLLPLDRRPTDTPALPGGVRKELRILCERGAGEGDDVRVHADLAAALEPLESPAQCLGQILETAAGRGENQIEERRDAEAERR